MSQSYDDSEIIEAFVQESQEHLTSIEPALISLEEKGSEIDSETINLIFRAIHSIKGSAGFFGFQNITNLSHIMENMMAEIRDATLAPSPEVVDSLLKGLDKLTIMIDDVSNSEKIDASNEIASIEVILGKRPAKDKKIEEPKSKEKECEVTEANKSSVDWNLEEYKTRLDESIRFGQEVFTIFLPLSLKKRGRKKELSAVKEQLDSIGTLYASKPEVFVDDGINMKAIKDESVVSILFSTILEEGLLLDFLKLTPEGISRIDLPKEKKEEKSEPVSESVSESKDPDKSQSVAKTPVSAETVRIRVELLDKLMALAGEIVLGRNRLMRQFGDNDDLTIMNTHSHRITELQESIMKMRLQPVGTVFSKFRRIVRDMSIKVSKEINLVLNGEDVELDRSIINGLSDPLTHIIRNSADHGLESPDDREALGKPRAGTIILSALHEGGHVIITAEDDGRGIDAEKVKAKAVEKEVISKDEAGSMSEREAVKLIFHPGFSTIENVSEISGRGVGMDVVRSTFEKLGGIVDLETEVGKGSKIIIRLPLTLAIVPSLVVGVEGARFAIPQVDLVEVVRLKRGGKQRTELIQGQEVLRVRGKLLPITYLADLLNIKKHYLDGDTKEEMSDRRDRLVDRRAGQEEKTDDDNRVITQDRRSGRDIKRVVVLNHNGNFFGLIVDSIFDPEEIVVKPLSDFLKSCSAFSGCTIMGDGEVAMILNVMGIVEMSGFKFEGIEERTVEVEEEERLAAMERETLLLFQSCEAETFCLSFSGIARVERVESSSIEKVGPKEFVLIRDESVPLVRLENILDVAAVDASAKTLYVIIPKGLKKPVGIVSTKIIDTIERVADSSRDSADPESKEDTIIVDDRIIYRLDMSELLKDAGLAH